MSLLGPLSLYLGVDFFYNPTKILISHHRYILRCLTNVGLSQNYPKTVSMDPHLFTTLFVNMPSPLLTNSAITYYHYRVGKLLHVLNTQPDVAFATNICTRFITAPREAHLQAMIHILQYLRGTSDLALHYQRRGQCAPIGFSDSDYLGDQDERRSTSGTLITLETASTS